MLLAFANFLVVVQKVVTKTLGLGLQSLHLVELLLLAQCHGQEPGKQATAEEVCDLARVHMSGSLGWQGPMGKA